MAIDRDKLKGKLKLAGIGLVVLLVVSSAAKSWFTPPQVIKEYTQVPVEKEVIKIKKVEVPIERIVTYEKPVIVEKLKLPDWVATDANKQVIANAEIPPYEGKTSAVTVLDTKTGEASIIAKQKPLPFFELRSDKEMGARYGYSAAGMNIQPQINIFGRYTFARLGSFYSALYIEGSSKPEAKGMLEVSYRWK